MKNPGISISRGGAGTGHVLAEGDAVAHAGDPVAVGGLGTEGLGDPETEEVVPGDGEVNSIAVTAVGFVPEQ